MPLYDYDCPECGKFERAVAMSERNDVRCECGREAVKLFSTTTKIYSNRRFREPDQTITKEDIW